jgi:hypothetical protein
LRLFRIESDKNFKEYKMQDFKADHREEDLESLLETNPDVILEEELMIIGRQIVTNLNTSLDLLGLDRTGNVVVLELKRDKTPRDTIAQALEYASYIEQLNYNQLEEIYQKYTDSQGLSLSEQHRTFFGLEDGETVNYNKEQHITVIGSDITREIKQQATYLNRKGIPTTCVEFKYFETESGEILLSTDIAITGETSSKIISSEKQTKTTYSTFIDSLDENSRAFFEELLDRLMENGLIVHWGTVGFSLNVGFNGVHVSICEGYPIKDRTRYNASVYGIFSAIIQKVANSEILVEEFRERFIGTGVFVTSGKNVRWTIESKPSSKLIQKVVGVYLDLAKHLKEYQLKVA